MKHCLATLLVIAVLCAATLPLGGCAVASWVATGITDGTKKVSVDPEYTGLDNKSVAVMVSADPYLQFRFPDAAELVNKAISRRLSENVTGVVVKNPLQVAAYQEANPNWATMPYSKLIEALDVDRLIIIDLIDYRTHEPGNRHIWQGVISANVGVVERKSLDPDSFAYYQNVSAVFPEDIAVGVVNASDEQIQLGMLTLFSKNTVNLFHKHEKEVPI